MRPSKHESVRPKPIKTLRLRRSVVAEAGDRPLSYLDAGTWRYRCSIGRSGVTRSKREGDGCTPMGSFALLAWRFRPQGSVRARAATAWRSIRADDGWCDDPRSGAYNRPVKLPCAFGHEDMWRRDGKYDVVGILDYNIRPRKALLGSAIFFHLCSDAFETTAGCVAVTPADMRKLLPRFATRIKILI